MKLFGNSKHNKKDKNPAQGPIAEQPADFWEEPSFPAEEPMSREEPVSSDQVISEEDPERKTPKATSRITANSRAMIWLFAGILVFVSAVVMCIVLIVRSADVSKRENIDLHVEDIQYVVGDPDVGTGIDATTAPEIDLSKLPVPVSKNDSEILNILLVGLDNKTRLTDTMILFSVDTKEKSVSMLSIPRDTYIAGDFEIPKANRIYGDSGKRGISALQEMVKNMVGFPLDYYFLFDADTVGSILELTGDLDFTVPSDCDYSELEPGNHTMNEVNGFDLFCYREDYDDTGTGPYTVQQRYLAAILDTLIQDQENLIENADEICEAADTDLKAGELAYLGNLLKDFQFASAYCQTLPGEEVDVDGTPIYQVIVESACDLLNEHFNPLDKELTRYDLNFRQKQGDSGDGYVPVWGDPTEEETKQNGNSEPTESGSSSGNNPTESTEGSSGKPSEGTSTDTGGTEEPTEAPPTEPATETPVVTDKPVVNPGGNE